MSEPELHPIALTDLLDLTEIEATRLYAGTGRTHLQRAFGGQVLAQSLLAAYRSVEGDRLAHSLHAYFLKGGRTDMPILYDVEETREGKSFSSRRVIARQAGSNIFQSAVSFHRPEESVEHRDAYPARVPGPDDCPPLGEVLARGSSWSPLRWEQEWAVLDVRYVGDSHQSRTIRTESHGAHLRVWVRLREAVADDVRFHQAALAYLSDLTLLSVATVPHPELKLGSPSLQVASIDHSMWFHRPARADQWLLYDQVSPSMSHSLGFSHGRIFQDEVLVASCAQEGLLRQV